MLLDYECRNCGAFMDDYWHRRSDTPDGEPPEAFDCPECRQAQTLARVRVYVQHVHGPVWTNLDDINYRLLSAKDRRLGKEIRNQADIQKLEEEKGVFRPSATEERVWRDESLHDGAAIRKVLKEDGQHAAEEYVDTTEIMGVTGWTKQETEQWKARTNAASARIDASAFEPSR